MSDVLQIATLIVGLLVGLSALANNVQTYLLARIARINRQISESNAAGIASVVRRVEVARTQGVANHDAIREVAGQTTGLFADLKAAVLEAAGQDKPTAPLDAGAKMEARRDDKGQEIARSAG